MDGSKPSKRRSDALRAEAKRVKTEYQMACDFVIEQACIETAAELNVACLYQE